MRPAVNAIVLVAFGICLFAAIVFAANTREQEVAFAQFTLLWLRSAIGVFIATVAALALLLKSLSDAPLDRVCVLLLPLLGGLCLIELHWTATVPLGIAILGLMLRELIAIFATGRSGSVPAAEGDRTPRDWS